MSKSALKAFRNEEFTPTHEVVPPARQSVMTANLSVRIDPRISAATLRAITERKIERVSPSTQQDIVAEAMVDWLKKNGYWKS